MVRRGAAGTADDGPPGARRDQTARRQLSTSVLTIPGQGLIRLAKWLRLALWQ